MNKQFLFPAIFLLFPLTGSTQVLLISENIQNWTNQGAYSNHSQSIPVEDGIGDVIMTDCLIQNNASATGTCSSGRIQIKALTGTVVFPEISSVKTVEFHFAAGAAGRSVKLQKADGSGGWNDITTFTGIGTTGVTYTSNINQSTPVVFRLTSASHTIYLHDILINTRYFNSASTGSLELTSSWGTKSDGSGTHPLDFSSDGQVFTVLNNTSPTIGDHWNVSGINSKIVVGDGLHGCNMYSGIHPITTGDLEIKSNASLTLNSDETGTGSLIVNGNSSGNVTVQRYIPDGTCWHYVSSPVHGQFLNESWLFDNAIDKPSSVYQFFRFDEPLNYWIIYGSIGSPAAFGESIFTDARGYALKLNSAGVLSFTGSLLTSQVDYPATVTGESGSGFNLVGNPFPSSIGVTSEAGSLDNFLNINDGILDASFKALYIWDEQEGYSNRRNDYRIISNAMMGGYTQISQNYLQSGQAFMVKVVSAGNIRFTGGMRQHAVETFHGNFESWPGIELGIHGNTCENTTQIGFHEGMTTGLDPSYDVGKMKGNPCLSLYTRLVEDNGVDFAVQCLPLFTENFTVDVGIETSASGEFILKALTVELPDSINVMLEDLESDRVINFRTTPEYPFVITNAGTINSRFRLHFNHQVSGIHEKEQERPQIIAWENMVYISANEIPDSHVTGQLRVLDISGKTMINIPIDFWGKFSLKPDLPAGFYLVQLLTTSYSQNKKIFIHHK